MHVFCKALVVGELSDSSIFKAGLPDFTDKSQLFVHPMREPAFDELDSLFQSVFFRGSEEQMKVVGHDHKFMQEVFPLLPINLGVLQSTGLPSCQFEKGFSCLKLSW